MRTTIILNDNIFKKISVMKARTGKNLSEVVNDLLEKAISAKPSQRGDSFHFTPRKMQFNNELDFSNTGRLLDILEGSLHK